MFWQNFGPIIGYLLLFLSAIFGTKKLYKTEREKLAHERERDTANDSNSKYNELQEDLKAEREQSEVLVKRFNEQVKVIDLMSQQLQAVKNDLEQLRTSNSELKWTIKMFIQFTNDTQIHARAKGFEPLEVPELLKRVTGV